MNSPIAPVRDSVLEPVLAVADRAEAARPPARTGFHLHTFSALHHRNFRVLWIGTVCTTIVQFLQSFVLAWLTYELTGSATLLGAVVASTAVPALVVGPMAGVLSDRFDRRRLGVIGQGVMVLSSLAMVSLVLLDLIDLWHLFAFGVITGAAWALIHPVRHALTPNCVPRSDLLNAVALNSLALQTARLGAPALGGLLVAASGIASTFLVQGAAALVALVTLAVLVIPPTPGGRRSDSMGASFIDGLRYICQNQAVGAVLLLGILLQFLVLPSLALMPIFAKEIFEGGPEMAGLLFGAPGLGAVAATLALASFGDVRRKGVCLLLAAGMTGGALVAFSIAAWLPLAIALLIVLGAAQGVYLSLNNTLLQSHTADAYRGRVTSISTLNQSAVWLGGLLIGPMAARLGAPITVSAAGLSLVGLAVLVAVRLPRMRSLS